MERIVSKAKKGLRVALLLSVIAGFLGCDPVPRRTLTTEEKWADLEWAYSIFNANYAPMELKQSKYGFEFAQLKEKYKEEAKNTKTNDEFYNVLMKFIAEFKDAHTSGSLTNSELAGRARVAYLGFSGIRNGNALVVTEFLPTQTSESSFPLEQGDLITKIDGIDLPVYIRENLVKYRDLGLDSANLTFHMNKIFNRVSTNMPLPTTTDAVLTVERDGRVIVVTLPWLQKDLVTFRIEQTQATADAKKEKENPPELKLSILGFNGRFFYPEDVMKTLTQWKSQWKNSWNSFQFIDNVSQWTTKMETKGDGEDSVFAAQRNLKAVRSVPSRAIFIEQARTYPTYVHRVPLYNNKGEALKKSKLVAYMLLDTFSPRTNEKIVEQEVSDTLRALKELGVKDIVIDMINNGGGSLSLGLKLAQLFSSEKIAVPSIQFRLNDSWMDQLQSSAEDAPSDTEKELNRRVFDLMNGEYQAGKRLSRPTSLEVLMPFELESNASLDGKLNVVLLVNEMCASMCDIFSAMMQDNGLAKVIGSKTMGAGGNVAEDRSYAPNSRLSLRQTQSLIMRKDGSYVENNGVIPDFEVDVSSTAFVKYEPIRAAGVLLLSVE